MVLDDQTNEPVNKMSTFLISNTVDLLSKISNSKNTLPAGDWISADYRVLRV